MDASKKTRIYFTGVGGQGTLTATTLLANTALAQGLDVTSGEIHGMAQRGGVVESTLLLGGWKSPKIAHGEADVMLAFEPLESLRGLPYLRRGGVAVCNIEPIQPIGVSMGRETYPDVDSIRAKVEACAGRAVFLPCRTLGEKAGAVQSGNIALMAALCATDTLPFGVEALREAIGRFLKPKLQELNLRAVDLGVEAVNSAA